MKLARMVLGFLFLFASLAAHALDLPARPTGFVGDYAGLMSPDESRALNNKLGAFRDSSRVSIVIATISSATDYGYSGLAEMGTALFERWAPGEKGLSSGMLIIIAGKSPPYKIRIVTGRGVEGAVPDLAARRIIEEHMRPAMQTGAVGAVALGLNRGIDVLMERTKNEFAPKSALDKSVQSASNMAVLVPLLLVLGMGAVLFIYIFHNGAAKQRVKELREQEERDAEARLRAEREQNYYATARQPTTYRETPARAPTRSREPVRTATHQRSEDSDDTPAVIVVTRTQVAEETDMRNSDTDPTPDCGGDTAGGGAGDD